MISLEVARHQSFSEGAIVNSMICDEILAENSG